MRILISGASGFIGGALQAHLQDMNYSIVRLVRGSVRDNAKEILWAPETKQLLKDSLEGFDAIIHLAAESIASNLWTKSQKERILHSRLEGTSLLANTISQLQSPPSIWISASAIGFYGDRSDEILDENSKQGTGFLSDVCQVWENAASLAKSKGVRIINARIGLVLDSNGGLLQRLAPIFRLGLGGRLGKGNQFMSWITRRDLVRALEFCLHEPSISGPVNLVSPEPIRNREFTSALSKALKRPAVFPVPEFFLKLLPGDMGNELLLSSARVMPQKLLDSGFEFQDRSINDAFRSIFGSLR